MRERRINRAAERVECLPLPRKMPAPEARQGQPGSYETDLWNFEYQVVRFLERATPEYLDARHKDIVRNLRSLVTEQRDVIPIESFLSSWYWIRKEYQTRVEYALRGKILPPPAVQLYQPTKAPVRPKWPNAGDLLFRYGRKVYLQSTLSGSIRLANCDNYLHMKGDLAREDIEREKSAYLAGRHTRITTADGRQIPIKGDVMHSVHGPRYYLLSLTAEWNDVLFDEFLNSDACLVIRNTEEFRNRLKAGCESAVPGCQCELVHVEYFDPYERPPRQIFDSMVCKDFRFAYQQEWRFVCMPPKGEDAREEHFTFTVAPLSDVAVLMDRAPT